MAERLPCIVDGCDGPRHGNGYCSVHYWRMKRRGKLEPARQSIAFHVDKLVRETDECILWDGRTNGRGYGKYGDVYVHRYTYEAFVGTIPDGLTIDHLCRNKLCCNPRHLEPVTREENHRRWAATVALGCKKGHPADEHAYVSKSGKRVCRTCRRDYKAARRAAGLAA